MEQKVMDFLSRARWLLLSGLRAIQQLDNALVEPSNFDPCCLS